MDPQFGLGVLSAIGPGMIDTPLHHPAMQTGSRMSVDCSVKVDLLRLRKGETNEMFSMQKEASSDGWK